MIARHRKLIAALVGVLLLFLQRRYGFEVAGLDEALVELAIGILTPLAVWWFPNEQKQA